MKLSMYIVEKLLVLLLVNHVNGDGMEFESVGYKCRMHS